ncbi:ABC transporter permease [Streptomyces sp. Ncost-T10-10d]|uniref:ABC transporter permease n=1 Tax=Streptomyces sp. Ncost-T10-10d TaxID=1839774 RepID=UPI00081E89B9|nr:FtsX-like permease family protein [Streptomyces sp. Ncost-T10-10d]SCF69002.1 putative ABC transport system permease protein [Streptomyces sp. Ncost-T10-10d]
MGRLTLIARLALRGLRRHLLRSVTLLLAVTTACGAMALGMMLRDAAAQSYAQIRAATNGPDVMAMPISTGDTARNDLAPLFGMPGVVTHSGPYPVAFPMVQAHGLTVQAVVAGRTTAPDVIDHPQLTQGSWVRPGGAVVERAFALALGLHTGDHLTVAGRTFTVTGIALTAAAEPYPGAQWSPQGGGPSLNAGLLWLTQADLRSLASPRLPLSYTANLKLAEPQDAESFVNSPAVQAVQANVRTWQDLARNDRRGLRIVHEAVTVGSWLLISLALAGASALVAGRMAEQTRRVGLFKAVGATPGLVAAVMLTEYLALALAAGAAGLALGCLLAPALTDPGARLLDMAFAAPSAGTVTAVAVTALAISAGATIGPAWRAARTTTAHGLADPARAPGQYSALGRHAAWLPIPLMLGLRLAARRPRRALLTAAGTFTVTTGLFAALTFQAQPPFRLDLGASTLPDPSDVLTNHIVQGVIVALNVLAVVSAAATAWNAALDARRPLAVARTLGATPGQVTTGLISAQLLPALPAAAIGVPAGMGLCALLQAGPDALILPSSGQTVGMVAATLLGLAALTTAPAWLSARQPVHKALHSEQS